jgi:hypothetical protein
VLYCSLPFAAALVVLAHVAARRAPDRTRWVLFFWCGVGVAFGPALGLFAFPVVMLLFVLLLLALMTWPVARGKVSTFLPLSAAAVVVAYGVVGGFAVDAQVNYNRTNEARNSPPA